MHLTFDTIRQASSALELDERFFTAARAAGCMAFAHGRVRAGAFVEFLDSNLPLINAFVEADWPYVRVEPPQLEKGDVSRIKRRLKQLIAAQTSGKRFVGRAIAAAVKRELTPDLARKLATMTPEAAETALHEARNRILTA